MGCPNWQEDESEKSSSEIEEGREALPGSGIMMIAHKGYGTWTKRLNSKPQSSGVWTRCFVDSFDIIHKARFCIPESQTWESLPLSSTFNATSNANDVESSQILLLATCCGRYEKYYLYMFSTLLHPIKTFWLFICYRVGLSSCIVSMTVKKFDSIRLVPLVNRRRYMSNRISLGTNMSQFYLANLFS